MFTRPHRLLLALPLALALGCTADQGDDSAETEEIDGDEPIEDWKVLRPEERKSVPEDQWIWRWVKMSKSMGNVITPDEIAVPGV